VRQRWTDVNLKWDPKKWNNITSIIYDPNEIWLPDIFIYNNANQNPSFGPDFYKEDALIRNDGYVDWKSPVIFKSVCKFDIKHFPFDQHNCSFEFGSLIYDVTGIKLTDINYPVIDANNYFNSSHWDVKRVWYTNENIDYPCCKNPYSVITFYITVRRKPLYHTFIFIIPCIVLISNLFIGFYLPIECGERVGLTMTILLAVAVFLQSVSDTLPQNSDSIPILGEFYILIMAECTFSLIATCIVLVVYYRSIGTSVQPIPHWLKKIVINNIGKILAIKRDNEKDNTINYNRYEEEEIPSNNTKALAIINKGYVSDNDNNFRNSKLKDVVNEIQILRSLILKNNTNDEDEDLKNEWKYVAKILDRFFFWFMLIMVTATSVGILVPSYYQHA